MWKHHADNIEARAAIKEQTLEEDLETIDRLFGRSNLPYGATPKQVKAEALRQVKIAQSYAERKVRDVQAEARRRLEQAQEEARQEIKRHKDAIDILCSRLEKEAEAKTEAEAAAHLADGHLWLMPPGCEVQIQTEDEKIVNVADLINTTDASTICGYGPRYLRKLAENGKGPTPIHLGHVMMYERAEVEAFAEARRKRKEERKAHIEALAGNPQKEPRKTRTQRQVWHGPTFADWGVTATTTQKTDQ